MNKTVCNSSSSSNHASFLLTQLIDAGDVERFVDDFFKLAGIHVAIIDVGGNPLTNLHFTPICESFHQKHPETKKQCLNTISCLSRHLVESKEDYLIQKCPNGLNQVIVPIRVKENLLGFLVLGQMFVKSPDKDWFSERAERYNFDSHAYLADLDEVPVLNKDELNTRISFLTNFSKFIGNLGVSILNSGQADYESKLNQRRYQTVVENTNEAIIISRNDQVTFVNKRARELTGFSESQLLSRTFSDIAHPAFTNNIVLKLIENDLARKASIGNDMDSVAAAYDIKINTNEGKSLWVEVKPVSIDWDNEKATLTFLNDITERKEAEEAIRASEEKLKMMLENSVLGTILFQDGKYLYINDAALQMSGYSRSEALEWREDDFLTPIHPEDIDTIVTAHDEAERDGKNEVVFTYRLVTKSGRIRWNEQFDKKVMYNGKPAVLMMMHDITKRKIAENELKESEEKYREVVNNSAEGICVIQEGYLKYFNPELSRIFKYSEDDLMKMSVDDLLKPCNDQSAYSEEIILRSVPSSPIIHSFHVKNSQDCIRLIDIKSVVINWETRPAILAFMTDVTEKKLAEELIIQTDKMMSLGGLAGGIAHEVNNPLGSIIQAAQNILRRLSPSLAPNEEAARKNEIDLVKLQGYLADRKIDYLLDGILDAGKRATKIISNVLQFSRKSNSETSHVDLIELIDRVSQLMQNGLASRSRVDFRNIVMTREYDTKRIIVQCVETEIEQVIMNLLTNAAYALSETPKDHERKIAIRASELPGFAKIEIEDSGPGIDPTVRKRIFEPFFTTKPSTVGTGLGLSVSYTIITNNHNGSIEVHSDPGKGTLFIIHLPLTLDIC